MLVAMVCCLFQQREVLWEAKASVRALAVSESEVAVGTRELHLIERKSLRHRVVEESSNAPIWSIASAGPKTWLTGDAKGMVRLVRDGRTAARLENRLSGWVRSIVVSGDSGSGGDTAYAVGCNTISQLKLPSLEVIKVLDAGRTSDSEEPWRRHDILCIDEEDGHLVAGLNDGSLRYFKSSVISDERRGPRVIGAFFASSGGLITADRLGTVRRYDDKKKAETRSVSLLNNNGDDRLTCSCVFRGLVVLGTTEGIIVLDDLSLDLRWRGSLCSDEIGRKISALAVLNRGNRLLDLVVADGHGQVSHVQLTLT